MLTKDKIRYREKIINGIQVRYFIECLN
jgi:hypothetical protein